MLKLFFAALLVCAFPAAGWAETIYMKNGDVIKAKITKDTGYSVQIMQGGFPKLIMMENVDRIEQDGQASVDGAPTVNPQAAAEPLTDEKKQLIIRLVEANGARESMSQTFAQIIENAPPEAKEQYRNFLKVDEIIDRIVPVYAKLYTTQELQEVVNFYKSPVGQKHIQTTPQVVKETMMETIKYFQEKIPQPNVSR